MKDLNGKNIWLIGASSGIGEALAKELAMQGANLALSARREKELDKVKKSLQGNKNISLPLDVSNLDELKKAASKLKNDWGQIDSVITLAAIYYPEKIQKLEAEKTQTSPYSYMSPASKKYAQMKEAIARNIADCQANCLVFIFSI